ncbi:MerR family transcriptional regulator [Clostridium sediminicola]|uniref:MerR family transcriptional regulator n=1 Tax=Clostridium sediminicola TaxID=3114879 RepID=UPI0031F1F7EC
MYKIKEVSALTGLTAHTLRYYEKEGILPPISRDEAGRRIYTQENIVWLDIVTCLKQTKMPVSEIKKIVKLSIEGDSTIPERKDILLNHRKVMEEQLEEIKAGIKKIDKKIAFYDGNDMC